jgi:PPOX class probable F420-dependent enzyme
MRLPPLTDGELQPFLTEGLWVAKLGTHNADGSIRITPLTYGVDDGDIVFSTWQNSAAVRNVRRDGTASVLIDRAEPPYAGVHYTGRAEVLGDDVGAEEYGRWFQRYIGSVDEAVEAYNVLVNLGIGERAFIRFHPDEQVTWDFAKVPSA